MSASLILVAMFGGAVLVTALCLSSLIQSGFGGYSTEWSKQTDNGGDKEFELRKLIDPDFIMAASAFSIALAITSLR